MALVSDDPLLYKLSAEAFSRNKRPSNSLRLAPVVGSTSTLKLARQTVRNSRDSTEAVAEARLARSLPAIARGYGKTHGAQYVRHSGTSHRQRAATPEDSSHPVIPGNLTRLRASSIARNSDHEENVSEHVKLKRAPKSEVELAQQIDDGGQPKHPIQILQTADQDVSKCIGSDEVEISLKDVDVDVVSSTRRPAIQRQNRLKRGGGILNESVVNALNPRVLIDNILDKFETKTKGLDEAAILQVVDYIDDDGQGLITSDEFEGAMRQARRNEVPDKQVASTLLYIQLELELKGLSISDVFRVMDDSGDGILDGEEIVSGLKMITGRMNHEEQKNLAKARDIAAKRRWRKRQENVELERGWLSRPESLPKQHQPKQYFTPPSSMPRKQIVGGTTREQRTFERLQAEVVIELFDKIDLDQDGEISSDDLEMALMKFPMLREVLGKNLNSVDREPFVKLFSSMDADRDGTVSLREFGMFVRSRPIHAEALRNLTARRVRYAKDQKLQRRASKAAPDSSRSNASSIISSETHKSAKQATIPDPQRIERLRSILDVCGGESLKVAGEQRFCARNLPNLHEMRSSNSSVALGYNQVNEDEVLKRQLGRYQFESRLALL